MSQLIHQKKQAWPKASKRRRVLWGALTIASVVGCLYDKDDPCGPNQVTLEGVPGVNEGEEMCVCAPNTVPGPEGGCVACGAHEIVGATGCACEPGYARGPDNVCAEVTGGAGLPCTTDAECLDLAAPHCEPSIGGDASYCTSQNCDATSCGAGFSCNLAATPTYCQRAPTGFGEACASDADCASFDATFCNAFGGNVCYVRDCTQAPDSCTPGLHCCVLAAFAQPNLCLPETIACP